MYFVPFSVSFICTLLIVKKLLVKQTFTNQQLAANAQRNRRISAMLLFICFTYIITTLPNRLCFSVFELQIIGYDYTDTVFLVSNTLMYTRNAMNVFFLYISVHGFRRDVRRLIFTCWRELTGQTPLQGNSTTEHVRTTTAFNETTEKQTSAMATKKSFREPRWILFHYHIFRLLSSLDWCCL